MIGTLPDSNIKELAQEIHDEGLLSCEAAEADGWIVTDDQVTRLRIDASIMMLCLGRP